MRAYICNEIKNNVEEVNDSYKTFIAGVMGGILGFVEPIANDVFVLIYIFVMNFVFGYLQDKLVNGNDFSFKKAWRCVVESCIFFLLIATIFVIGKMKNQVDGALQCASTVTWAVLYFYATNIMRNMKAMLKPGHPAHSCVAFIYWLLSFEVVKKIPLLDSYINSNKEDS